MNAAENPFSANLGAKIQNKNEIYYIYNNKNLQKLGINRKEHDATALFHEVKTQHAHAQYERIFQTIKGQRFLLE